MAKSSARGVPTSVEVLGITPHALWLMVGGRELMLDFERFPWFARASIEDICDLTMLHGHHLWWPRLDIDLHVDSIEHPERFPLVSRAKGKRKTTTLAQAPDRTASARRRKAASKRR
jgi:hypothetical protein